MKKILIYIFLGFLFVFSGCVEKKELAFAEDKIYLTEEETYELKPINPLVGIDYSIKDQEIASIDNEGKIIALKKGNTTIVATYKNTTKEIDLIVSEGLFQNLSVYIIDVGQGDAIFIQLPNGENMMIDAGYGTGYKDKAWANITSTLDGLGVGRINHFLITHNHADHYAFVPDIINYYGIDNIYGSGSKRTNTQYLNIMQSIKNAGLEYYVLEVGDLIFDEEFFKMQVVATQRLENDSDPNISSVMIRLSYKQTAFMFTGDGGFKNSKDAEYIAINSKLELSADVLKVGHHGSKYSSGNEFLNAVKPKYAIMTTAVNSSDGLPTQDAINRITAVGAVIYQTKDHGTITIISDGTNITIATEK